MFHGKKQEHLTAKKILDAYKEGRRDFSGILCNNDSFDNFDLRGIILTKANLSYCSFYGTNLEGADLSEAILEWTGFIRANLKGANFEKARATWSRFNESVFEKTNMKGADLNYSLFLQTNLYAGADLTNAQTATIATDPSQITEEGLKELQQKIGGMHGKMDPELLTRLQLIASSTKETFDKPKNFGDNIKVGYDSRETYSASGGNYAASSAKVDYGTVAYSGRKKKKGLYEK